MAAVMAGEEAAVAVQHERDVALRAAPHPPARAARQEVRPAAAVEQHDRLTSRLAHLRKRLRGLRVQPCALAPRMSSTLTSGSGRPSTRVDRRSSSAASAMAVQRRGARGQRVSRGHAQADALRTRGGAAEQQQRAACARSLGRDVAGVVARVAFVLVGGVVLLVHDDQAEVLDRREHGRARTDAHARLCSAQPPPFLVALAWAQARVQHRDGLAEALQEAPDDLWRQRDLRDEHDRTPALLQHNRGGAQVDLGLARSRHPLQQALLKAVRVQRRAQRPQGQILLWCEHRGLGATSADGQVLRAHDRPAFAPAQAARRAGRQHQRQRSRDRRAVLSRDPLGQRDQLDGQGGGAFIQRTQRREQLLLGDLAALGHADDDPEHVSAGERHDQHRPDTDDARRAAPPAGGSRTARAGRGRWSSARPGRWLASERGHLEGDRRNQTAGPDALRRVQL